MARPDSTLWAFAAQGYFLESLAIRLGRNCSLLAGTAFVWVFAPGFAAEATNEPTKQAATNSTATARGKTNEPPMVRLELLPLTGPLVQSAGVPFRIHTNALHWTWEFGVTRARFGGAVNGNADLDGDGFRDLAIGAYTYGGPQSNAPGLVIIIPGAANGFRPYELSMFPSLAGLSGFGRNILGVQNKANGRADELWVGAAFSRRNSIYSEQLLVFSGSSTGLQHVPYWTGEGPHTNSGFGTAIDSAGDVNGDGIEDFVVGASLSSQVFRREGAVFAFYGRRDGVGETADWEYWGNEASMDFGSRVAGAGDVNGDGYDDVLVSSPIYPRDGDRRGRVWLFLGSKNGLSSSPDRSWDGPSRDSGFGEFIVTAGDLDGDGCSEFFVSAPALRNRTLWRGEVSLFRGAKDSAAIKRSWKIISEHSDFRFGDSLAVVGDVDGDGFRDLVVGIPNSYPGTRARGRVLLYRGKKGGFFDEPDWTLSATNSGRVLGRLICSLGDVNRDGLADFAIGTPGWVGTGESSGGRVDVFFGSRQGYRAGDAFPADGINSVLTSQPLGSAPVEPRPTMPANVNSPDEKRASPRSRLAITGLALACGLTGAVILWRVSTRRRLKDIETERGRLARDLHDDLGARLARISLLTELVRRDAGQSEEGKKNAQVLSETAREVLGSMEQILWSVNPANDTLENLVTFIVQYAGPFFAPTGITFRYNVAQQLPESIIQPATRKNLFLTVKEALNNIVKHSGATEAQLDIAVTGSRLTIVIEDNGRGLPRVCQHASSSQEPTDQPRPRRGNGLGNMRARIEEIRGEFEIGARNGGGTRVRIVVNI